LTKHHSETEAEPVRVRVELTKRDKLTKLRAETRELEAEILEDEQEAVSGPHRHAAGIPEA